MKTPTKAVVVGIGPDGYDAAVSFAVAEARRAQHPLHLVHVLEVPAGEAYAGVYGGLLDQGKAVLAAAVEAAEKRAGDDVLVTSRLYDNGWIVDDLVRHTEGASMLVLQHRALGRVKRVFTGSKTQGVAGRAHVPVISVPEGWDPDAPAKGRVTAAVQDAAEAGPILRAAFEEARARGAELDVLHAWWLSSGYDLVVVDTGMRADYVERIGRELEPALAPLRAEFPDVQVQVVALHAPTVEAVLEAAERSDLVVLGRRHHRLPRWTHPGPVVRAALTHASCPVLITPEQSTEPAVTTEPRRDRLVPTSG